MRKPLGARADYAALAGTWRVAYTNGTANRYTIDADGRLKGNADQASLLSLGGEVLLINNSDRLERLRLVGGRLAIEHFYPGSNFPHKKYCDGVGVKEK